MARKNQKLINYHTSSKTAMPSGSSVDYGEIVVRHNAESPELLIKVGVDSFGVFQASGAVKTAIDSAVSTAKSELNKNISDLETSLSGHVADFEKFQGDVEKTYATKTELKSASGSIITAYEKAVGDAKIEIYNSATTFATNAVNTAKTALDGNISSLETSLTEHVTTFNTFKGNVEKTYATKEELKSASGSIITAYEKAVGDAKVEIYNSATTFATNVKNELNGTISIVKSNLGTLSGVVESISTNIGDNYVTSADLKTTVETLEGKISTAKDDAISSGKTYTDAQIVAAKSYTDTEIKNAKSAIKQTTDALNSKIDIFSGNVETTLGTLKETLTEAIDNKVSVAYRYQGTVTNYADLPKNLTSGETGYVYNVENANGHIPAGTNYAWNGTAWDALGGIVDLTPYAKTSDVNNTVKGINQRIEGVESSVNTLSGNTDSAIASLKKYADDTFATGEELSNAQSAITTAYTKAVSDAKVEIYNSATTFATNAVNTAKNALNQSITGLSSNVTDLSASTVSIKATADSAVQTGTTNNGSGVVVTKNGTSLDFDFSNMIIDCGDFN